ncbi:thioredoxin [Tumebacillus sp. BK434]|uniref:thioredoxin family protein n=1 Tax=Tumebacillus sp. BK434 TaxID=2512169 RepID=UPI0010D24856|nr:thioredoxin family protein [Tumebacillus sp. BK434]TCP58283.1 thioredoxin [Tumebacillus sp. BK434]
MEKLADLVEVQEHISLQPLCLLFIKTADCGVCDDVYVKTEELLTKYPQVSAVVVSADESPAVAGEFLVFTAPTILLFAEGREVHRQARFVVFGKLEEAVQGWVEALS